MTPKYFYELPRRSCVRLSIRLFRVVLSKLSSEERSLQQIKLASNVIFGTEVLGFSQFMFGVLMCLHCRKSSW